MSNFLWLAHFSEIELFGEMEEFEDKRILSLIKRVCPHFGWDEIEKKKKYVKEK